MLIETSDDINLTSEGGLEVDSGRNLRIETPRWALPLYQSNQRILGAHGGRAGGKSFFFADFVIEQHLYNPNFRTLCLREIQGSLDQSVKHLLESRIRDLELDSYFTIQRDRILNKHGAGVIIFKGMRDQNAASLKSLEAFDLAWFEEAQNASVYSLDTLLPTIRKAGSRLLFSWNPKRPDDAIEKLLRGPNAVTNATVVQVNYYDNPHLTEESKIDAAMCRERDPDKYSHVWLGNYESVSSAQVFKNFSIEYFDTPDNASFRFGADWGFAKDPTVLIRCYIVSNKLYIDSEVYAHECPLDALPALFMTLEGCEKWPIVADSSRPETIDFMRRKGFNKIMPSIKGKNSIIDGIEYIKSFDVIIHPRCVNTIEEFKTYSYKTDQYNGAVMPVLDDKNNHCIDAIRYALESERRLQSQQVPVSVTVIPRMRIWN